MELDVPSSYPKESVPHVAEALHTCINKTSVVSIAKQHESDVNNCVVRIIPREICSDTLAFLTDNGYTEGPDVSDEFSLLEGQQLEVSCTGNIENIDAKDGHKNLTFFSYMGGVATDMTLRVKDAWKQKDLPAYIGAIKCNLLRKNMSSDAPYTRPVELTISLPKQLKPREAISVSKVRFPFYLISLATYLSKTLCQEDRNIWKTVLVSLLGSSEFSTVYRIARRKSAENNEESVCRAMLLDWMKSKAVHADKLSPIMIALKHNGYDAIAESCLEFVRFQKENLSDTVLIELAQSITKDVQKLGQDLCLNSDEIDRCTKQHPNNLKRQYVALMMEWRESEHVIEHHELALEYLRNICF